MYGCVSVTLRRVDSGVLRGVHHRIAGSRACGLVRRFHRRIPNVRLHAALVIKRPKRARTSFRRLGRFIHGIHFSEVKTFTCSRRRKACTTTRCRSSVPRRIGRTHLSRLVSVRRNVSKRLDTRGMNERVGMVVSQLRNRCCVKHARFSSPRISPRILVRHKSETLRVNGFCRMRVMGSSSFSLFKQVVWEFFLVFLRV